MRKIINTNVGSDWFLKMFEWKEDYSELKGIVVSNCEVRFYYNSDITQPPILEDSIPISKGQIKIIKKYLFGYRDIASKTNSYVCFSECSFNTYWLKGYYRNKYIVKKIIGDTAYKKIICMIFKVINNLPLLENDYIYFEAK